MAWEDLQDSVDVTALDELGDKLAEKAREHGETYHNTFCWNCGKSVTVATLSRCKACGAAMNGPWRFTTPCRPARPERAGTFSPSIMRFRRRSMLYLVVFGIIVTIIIAAVMFFASGDYDLSDPEDVSNALKVILLIWIFWIACFIYQFLDTGRKIKRTRSGNRDPRNPDNVCAMCGTPTEKIANYCGICGSAIPK